ncbi:regulator of G-protein signaling domain-containing protein [Nodosilinea sp. FACHB-13]|uniref:regulator of G-protein signaling domain-containing protein n=1 Tax=Cyanophyceae TaxID=3028117 RepID=UPI001686B2A4|nr:regulator of G-protein signaling domain-containing protein [Nodosilinea sp. FACHB-13]MBD2110058.1 hypothetical protein [Nodosilinea sp. FACHB-13]
MPTPPIFQLSLGESPNLRPNPRYLNPEMDRERFGREDNLWFQSFRNFAEKEFSLENLDFFAKTIGLEKLFQDPSTRSMAVAKLNSIIDEFVGNTAPRQVNFSAQVMAEFRNADSIDKKVHAIVAMKDEVGRLIKNDTLNRYLLSEDYKQAARRVDAVMGTHYSSP